MARGRALAATLSLVCVLCLCLEGLAVEKVELNTDCCKGREPNIITFATYPRSGNTWVRKVAELITNVATHTVYSETGRAAKAVNQQPEVQGWDDVTHSYYTVKTKDSEGAYHCCRTPVLLKTHFPAKSSASAAVLPRKNENVKAILRNVRNPLDNLDAYYRYGRDINHRPHNDTEAFAEFVMGHVEKFVEFHAFWDEQQDVDQIVVRYEDLLTCKDIGFWHHILGFFGFTDLQVNEAVAALTTNNTHPLDIGSSISRYPEELRRMVLEDSRIQQFMKKHNYLDFPRVHGSCEYILKPRRKRL